MYDVLGPISQIGGHIFREFNILKDKHGLPAPTFTGKLNCSIRLKMTAIMPHSVAGSPLIRVELFDISSSKIRRVVSSIIAVAAIDSIAFSVILVIVCLP